MRLLPTRRCCSVHSSLAWSPRKQLPSCAKPAEVLRQTPLQDEDEADGVTMQEIADAVDEIDLEDSDNDIDPESAVAEMGTDQTYEEDHEEQKSKWSTKTTPRQTQAGASVRSAASVMQRSHVSVAYEAACSLCTTSALSKRIAKRMKMVRSRSCAPPTLSHRHTVRRPPRFLGYRDFSKSPSEQTAIPHL